MNSGKFSQTTQNNYDDPQNPKAVIHLPIYNYLIHNWPPNSQDDAGNMNQNPKRNTRTRKKTSNSNKSINTAPRISNTQELTPQSPKRWEQKRTTTQHDIHTEELSVDCLTRNKKNGVCRMTSKSTTSHQSPNDTASNNKNNTNKKRLVNYLQPTLVSTDTVHKNPFTAKQPPWKNNHEQQKKTSKLTETILTRTHPRHNKKD